MPLPSTPFAARTLRLVVLWVLAAVLPLQGAAAGVFAAQGPAHVHRDASAARVLTDVRRWKPSPLAATVHVFTAFGHFHAGAVPQRHYHVLDDGSVVRTDSNGPEPDEALGVGAPPVLAMIPARLHWTAPRPPSSPDAGPLWAVRTGFTAPLDRPPKRA